MLKTMPIRMCVLGGWVLQEFTLTCKMLFFLSLSVCLMLFTFPVQRISRLISHFFSWDNLSILLFLLKLCYIRILMLISIERISSVVQSGISVITDRCLIVRGKFLFSNLLKSDIIFFALSLTQGKVTVLLVTSLLLDS